MSEESPGSGRHRDIFRGREHHVDKSLSPEAKAALLARSEALFSKGEESERNKEYVYGAWATAYYLQGRYADARAMVAKQRAAGGQPDRRWAVWSRQGV